MLIESKIRREGGSKIDVGGTLWHFAPGADGAHVCDVTDEAAIARFLAIPEGYRLVMPAATAATATAAPAATAAADKPEGGMVLKNGDESFDLMEMNKKALLQFGKEAGFKVDAMASAQAIRESIYKQAKG